MRKLSLFLALAVILSVSAIGLGYRLVLTQQGRSTKSVALDNERRLLKPRTLEDLTKKGQLSILSGREIHHVFRAQIPVVPYLSTQASLLKIDTEKSYIITSEREIFERLKEELDSVSVYSNNRLTFNGVLYPKAFVLESPLPIERFRDIPIRFPPTDDLEEERYVLLTSNEAFRRFLVNREPNENLNLILPGTKLLNQNRDVASFVRAVNSFTVLGKNALRARPGLNVHETDLLLIPKDFPDLTTPAVDWFRGGITPPDRTLYLYTLPLLMAALGFLGLIMRGYPLRWGLWAFIGVIGFLFAPNWHFFLAGLITSGLLQFGLRLRGASVPWFILSGTVAFGLGFQPYLVDPFFGIQYFWIGFLLGLLTTLSGWSERIKKNPTYGDVIALVLGLMVLGVAVLTQYRMATLGETWLAITLLPAVVSLVTVVNRPRHWPWMTGMAAWFILFYRSGNPGIFIAFLLSMAGWILIEKTRRFLTAGPTGRKPI